MPCLCLKHYPQAALYAGGKRPSLRRREQGESERAYQGRERIAMGAASWIHPSERPGYTRPTANAH